MRKPLLLIFLTMVLACLTVSAQKANKKRVYEKEYKWEYNNMRYTVSLHINKRLYSYYRDQREHSVYLYRFGDNEVQPNYNAFMLSEHDRQVINPLAKQLNGLGHTELERIYLALTFVQSLPYAYDIDTKGRDEYLRFPIETLVDGCGDCEDKVMLLAALLHEMDIDIALLSMPQHLALGVNCNALEGDGYFLSQDKRYYYAETTLANWKIGQVPKNYSSEVTEVIPIEGTPHLLCKDIHLQMPQTYGNYERSVCRLSFDLLNQGPKRAAGLWVKVRFVEQGKRKSVLSEESFFLDDLEEGEMREETLSFRGVVNNNSAIEIELGGRKIPVHTYNLDLDYRKVR